MANITTIESFVLEGALSSQAPRWKLCVERLNLYFTATAVAEDRNRALLLHLAGAEIYKLSKTLIEAPHLCYDGSCTDSIL